MGRRAPRFGSILLAVAGACIGLLLPAVAIGESPRATFGLGFGVRAVDLPDPDDVAGDDFGARPGLRVEAGVRSRAWLEWSGDLGVAFLGTADSATAAARRAGRDDDVAWTFVDTSVGVRLLGPARGRWRPYARGGVGAAWLVDSSDDARGTGVDLAWTGGLGLEVTLAARIGLRLEGRWIGQDDGDGFHHHATFDLVTFYALRKTDLE